MPFYANLELLLTPERLINTDLTKKGIYKIRIRFPNEEQQNGNGFRIGKVNLLPSNVYVKHDNTTSTNSNSSSNKDPKFIFTPTNRSLQLRLERYSTQLDYPSNARIQTTSNSRTQRSRSTSNDSSSDSSHFSSASSSASSNSRRRRSSIFSSFTQSRSTHATKKPTKQFTYSSRHFHVLYKEQEVTFLDNILISLEWMDLLDWMHNRRKMDLTVELCIFKDPSQTELKSFWEQRQNTSSAQTSSSDSNRNRSSSINSSHPAAASPVKSSPSGSDRSRSASLPSSASPPNLNEARWDPELARKEYVREHHDDEDLWETFLSNTLHIDSIWEGVNTVHPVAFTDGWDFCMVWMGIHSCMTRLQYYSKQENSSQSLPHAHSTQDLSTSSSQNIASEDSSPLRHGRSASRMKKSVSTPDISFLKPPTGRSTPKKQSSLSSRASNSPRTRLTPSKNTRSSDLSADQSPSRSSATSSVISKHSSSRSSMRRNSSIRRKLFAYMNNSEHSSLAPPLNNSFNHYSLQPMDEYVSQKYQRLFESEFIPFMNDQVKPLWPAISSMAFYSETSLMMTICTYFTRLMARNWQYMDEELNDTFTKIEGTDEFAARRENTKAASTLQSSQKGTSPGTPRRRASNPPPVSPSALLVSSPKAANYSLSSSDSPQQSMLWIPKKHRVLGEKWVQELDHLFKKRSEHPWLLPYVMNEIFHSPFELDLSLKWERFVKLCSSDLGSVHTYLRDQFRRNFQRDWQLFVHYPQRLHNKAHPSGSESTFLNHVTDDFLPSIRDHFQEKHSSSDLFVLDYLKHASFKKPPFLQISPHKGREFSDISDVSQHDSSSDLAPSSRLSAYQVDNNSKKSGQVDPLSSACKHLIVFVPGFKGSPYDFRLLRFLLELHMYPSQCKYFFFEPKSDLFHMLTIQDMCTSFAEALTNFIRQRNLEYEKISFFAHSLGGLIVRGALQPDTQAFQIMSKTIPSEKYYTLCTFGSPHLGSFSLRSKLVSTAIYLMSSVQKIKCLQTLSFSDQTELEESWLYLLNSQMDSNFMKHFKHVILCGSKQDTFVNFTSSTVFHGEEFDSGGTGACSEKIPEWIKSFDTVLTGTRVVRLDVKFCPTASRNSVMPNYQASFEKFTGKFFHVAYMLDGNFLNALIALHLKEIFES